MFSADFLRPGRIVALAAAAVSVVALGVLSVSAIDISCDPGPCPPVPVTGDGDVVSDRFWFLHRDLGPQGSVTVRLTSMTGTITYPPPDHDEIVPGLVPWAKTGIIVKDGLRPGSRYAALMMTGEHGVRFQHGYRHDVAGRPGGVSAGNPRWLRLTRSGDTITGAESSDGVRWQDVGSAELDGLPDTVQVGLFAASPHGLTLQRVALGGRIGQGRFTQAVGVFDGVTVEGGGGSWASEPVGEMNVTDWEKHHNPAGAVQADGVVTISGTGDIGPLAEDPDPGAGAALTGLVVALIIILVVAARYGRAAPFEPRRAATAGAAALVTGLLSVGTVLAVTGELDSVRVVAGLAVAIGLCAVLAYGLGSLLRYGWALALLLVAVPYTVTAVPLLPDEVARWLLRVTPAAGFAVKQTGVEYPQVLAHYAPSAGYFPLPWWAGLAVLAGWAGLIAVAAGRRARAHRPVSRAV
ncbi:hypothetical protein Aca07nite_13340 [Actinoplanes capillaceus]|uniref:DUF1349 domain-containing protein n=1 Tax=Actinoplanes campanulatus TaxID=113559 RepID=A0ABQ3WAI1_9ACTN|nr:hypothetical protein [Actinoplanes capillaceus]GID44059.1 hypothetical protein Aca07nite_13340 [Actinoplanes capillaceus]